MYHAEHWICNVKKINTFKCVILRLLEKYTFICTPSPRCFKCVCVLSTVYRTCHKCEIVYFV